MQSRSGISHNDEALVESCWVESQGKQVPRKYSRITASGKDALKDIYHIWKQISHGITHIMED